MRLGLGGLGGACSEHEAFGERVGGEAVRAVHAGARALADRVEAGQGGAPVQVAHDAADQVVGGGSDRDGLALGVKAGLVAGGEHVREACWVDRAQVERDVVAAVCVHPVENRGSELIARRKLVGEATARRRRAASPPRRAAPR